MHSALRVKTANLKHGSSALAQASRQILYFPYEYILRRHCCTVTDVHFTVTIAVGGRSAGRTVEGKKD